jgi:hypothetical protein
MEAVKKDKPEVNLAICIPSMGDWKADFGYALAQMVAHISCNLFDGRSRNCVVLDKRTSLLARSRQECLEDALNHGCTHALFLDVDQAFPQDTAHQLLKWGKPIVAANIPVKTSPSFPTARLRGPTSFGIPLDSHGKVGLEKVWRIGTGVMLIDLSILKDMPKPWFEVCYSKKNAQFIGEDWFFLGKAEEAGHDVYVDHDLSKQIGHTGNYVYTHANIPVINLEAAA